MSGRADAVTFALERIQGFSERERAVMLNVLTRGSRAISHPCAEVSARVPTLEGREFAWPEFDRWQAFFAARDVFPARWDGLQSIPPARTPAAETYLRRKLELLFEWLDALARRSAVVAHYAKRGRSVRVARQDVWDRCAACAPFVARQVSSAADALPPFHPGCRCVLLAVAPARSRARESLP